MNKKFTIVLIILFVLSTASLVFVNNNFLFYKTDIVRIDELKEEISVDATEPNILGIEEEYYVQKINGTYMNGKNKGKIINLENIRSTSNVADTKYEVGDYVFVSGNNIIGLKRDTFVVFSVVVFIILIFSIGQFRGLLSICSVILNIIIFLIGIKLSSSINIVALMIIESILFTVLSLIFANGVNRITFCSILSVIISTIILYLIVLTIILTTKYNGINFNGLGFLTVPPEDVFSASLLIGGLGAIMDVCITIVSSIKELIEKDKNITDEALIKSCRNIGMDIMGTMINVLFFTYLSSALPTFILALRNGVTLTNYISSNFSLEITRFLVGGISIVLSIFVSTIVGIKFSRRNA